MKNTKLRHRGVAFRGNTVRYQKVRPNALSLALYSIFTGGAASLVLPAALTWANPQGAQVVQGQATLQTQGNKLTVTNSAGAAINWQSFSIKANEQTHFQQPNSASSVLNRVVTNNPSEILGNLTSNGKVVLVNPFGITVGKGAAVDTAAFTASTLNISDADWAAGKMRFQGNALNGGVQVDGVIRSSNGDVMLFAPNVGIGKDALVRADNGNVIVGAGQKVEVTGRGLEGVKFEIQSADNKAINLGTLQGSAVGVFAGTLRHSGLIQAQAVTQEGGRIVLRALKDVELSPASKLIADGAQPAVAGGQKGGQITVSSAQGDVLVGQGAVISAQGAAGAAGGQILVQAEQGSVLVQSQARVVADGSPAGSIRIQAAQTARVAGVLSAQSPVGASVTQGEPLAPVLAGSGGQVDVWGSQVAIEPGTVVDVSGDAGGGQIRIGGDFQGANPDVPNARTTDVAPGVLLVANGRAVGDGGKVIVWADDAAYFSGTLQARGGDQGGNGGFGETSGKGALYFRGEADLSARRGRQGTLLLDPANITITAGTTALSDILLSALGTLTSSTDSTLNYTISATKLQSLGNSGNVLLQATEGISLYGSFDVSMSNSLTLQTTNGGSTGGGIDTGSYSGTISAGSINLIANRTGTNVAGINVSSSTYLIGSNGVSIAGDTGVSIAGTVASASGLINIASVTGSVGIASGGAVSSTSGQIQLQASGPVAIAGLVNTSSTSGAAGVVIMTDWSAPLTGSISSPNAPVAYMPKTSGVGIRVVATAGSASANVTTPLQFGLSNELANIAASVLQLGNANGTGGSVVLAANASPTGQEPANWRLYGSSVSQESSVTLSSVMASATGAVALDTIGNVIGVVAGKTTGVNAPFSVRSSGTLTVGSLGGFFGVTTASANSAITLRGGSLSVLQGINAGTGAAGSAVNLRTSSGGGVSIDAVATVKGNGSSTPSVFIESDNLKLQGTIDASGGTIAFNPKSSSRGLDIGTDSTLAFGLSAVELSHIANTSGGYFGSTLGDASALAFGDIKFSAPAAWGSGNLYLQGTGTVSQGSNGIATTGSLYVQAAAVSLATASNTITGAVGGVSTTGDFAFSNTGNLTLGVASGTVAVQSAGALSLQSVNGSILKSTASVADLQSSGVVVLAAGGGLGSSGASLRLSALGAVTLSSAGTGSAGDISVDSTGSLQLASVTTDASSSQTVKVGNFLSGSTGLAVVGSGFDLSTGTGDTLSVGTAGGMSMASSGAISAAAVVLKAVGGITVAGAGTAATHVAASGSLALQAGADIGSSSTPLRFAAATLSADTSSATAASSGNVYLAAPGAAFSVGSISTRTADRQTISIASPSYSLVSGYDVKGDAVTLTATSGGISLDLGGGTLADSLSGGSLTLSSGANRFYSSASINVPAVINGYTEIHYDLGNHVNVAVNSATVINGDVLIYSTSALAANANTTVNGYTGTSGSISTHGGNLALNGGLDISNLSAISVGAGTTLSTSYLNRGQQGSLSVDTGGLFSVGSSFSNSGTISSDGTLAASGTLTNAGVISGNATINASKLVNTGTLAPGSTTQTGLIQVNGALDTTAGTLRIKLDSGGNDLVSATGSISVSGSTAIDRYGAGTYSAAASFDILRSSTGIVATSLPQDSGFDVSTGTSGGYVTLTLFPISYDNYWSYSGSGLWDIAGNWTKGVPTDKQQVHIDGSLTVTIDGASTRYAGGVMLGSNSTLSITGGGILQVVGSKTTLMQGKVTLGTAGGDSGTYIQNGGSGSFNGSVDGNTAGTLTVSAGASLDATQLGSSINVNALINDGQMTARSVSTRSLTQSAGATLIGSGTRSSNLEVSRWYSNASANTISGFESISINQFSGTLSPGNLSANSISLSAQDGAIDLGAFLIDASQSASGRVALDASQGVYGAAGATLKAPKLLLTGSGDFDLRSTHQVVGGGLHEVGMVAASLSSGSIRLGVVGGTDSVGGGTLTVGSFHVGEGSVDGITIGGGGHLSLWSGLAGDPGFTGSIVVAKAILLTGSDWAGNAQQRNGGDGGNILLSANGDITVGASISSRGGEGAISSSGPSAGLGGAGGSIRLESTAAGGTIFLLDNVMSVGGLGGRGADGNAGVPGTDATAVGEPVVFSPATPGQPGADGGAGGTGGAGGLVSLLGNQIFIGSDATLASVGGQGGAGGTGGAGGLGGLLLFSASQRETSGLGGAGGTGGDAGFGGTVSVTARGDGAAVSLAPRGAMASLTGNPGYGGSGGLDGTEMVTSASGSAGSTRSQYGGAVTLDAGAGLLTIHGGYVLGQEATLVAGTISATLADGGNNVTNWDVTSTAGTQLRMPDYSMDRLRFSVGTDSTFTVRGTVPTGGAYNGAIILNGASTIGSAAAKVTLAAEKGVMLWSGGSVSGTSADGNTSVLAVESSIENDVFAGAPSGQRLFSLNDVQVVTPRLQLKKDFVLAGNNASLVTRAFDLDTTGQGIDSGAGYNINTITIGAGLNVQSEGGSWVGRQIAGTPDLVLNGRLTINASGALDSLFSSAGFFTDVESPGFATAGSGSGSLAVRGMTVSGTATGLGDGTLVFNGGTLRIQSDTAPRGGGVFGYTNALNVPLQMDNASTLRIEEASTLQLNADSSLGGTLDVYGGDTLEQFSGPGTLAIGGGATVELSGRSGGASGYGSVAITVAAASTLKFNTTRFYDFTDDFGLGDGLSGAGTLWFASGTAYISKVDVANYRQTGGALNAGSGFASESGTLAPSFTVNGSFSQTGGSIDGFNAVSVVVASGMLRANSISTELWSSGAAGPDITPSIVLQTQDGDVRFNSLSASGGGVFLRANGIAGAGQIDGLRVAEGGGYRRPVITAARVGLWATQDIRAAVMSGTVNASDSANPVNLALRSDDAGAVVDIATPMGQPVVLDGDMLKDRAVRVQGALRLSADSVTQVSGAGGMVSVQGGASFSAASGIALENTLNQLGGQVSLSGGSGAVTLQASGGLDVVTLSSSDGASIVSVGADTTTTPVGDLKVANVSLGSSTASLTLSALNGGGVYVSGDFTGSASGARPSVTLQPAGGDAWVAGDRNNAAHLTLTGMDLVAMGRLRLRVEDFGTLTVDGNGNINAQSLDISTSWKQQLAEAADNESRIWIGGTGTLGMVGGLSVVGQGPRVTQDGFYSVQLDRNLAIQGGSLRGAWMGGNGTLSIVGGATLDVLGSPSLAAANNSRVDNPLVLVAATASSAGGTLAVAGGAGLALGGSVVQLGGVLTVAGSSTASAAAGSLTLDGGHGSTTLAAGASLFNAGSVRIATNALLDGSLSVAGGGVLTVAADQVQFGGASTLYVASGAEVRVDAAQAATTFIAGQLQGDGAVNVNQGTLDLSGTTGSASGAFGAVHFTGTGTTLSVTGGSHQISSVGTMGSAAAYTVKVSGNGSLTAQSRFDADAVIVSGGTLDTTGVGIIYPDELIQTGGTIATAGLAVGSAFSQSAGLLTASGSISVTSGSLATVGGTVDAGSNAVTFSVQSLAVSGTVTSSGAVSLLASSGVTLSGGALLRGGAAGGTAIEIAAGNGPFSNTALAGAGVLDASGGRWLIWSADPANDTLGGLTLGGGDFKQYAAVHGSATPAQGSGNGLLYSLAPTLTVGLSGSVTRSYDGTDQAAVSSGQLVATDGLVSGDAVTLSAISATYDDRNVSALPKLVTASGISAVASTGLGANVYGYALSSTSASSATGTITPAAITLSSGAITKTYDGGTTVAAGAGTLTLVGGTLYTAAGDSMSGGVFAFTDKNYGVGNKTVTVGGATLSDGNGGANYSVSYQNNTTSTINQLAVANWTGGASNSLWSDPLNWAGRAVPDGNNASSVSIGGSGGAIIFDSTLGLTNLQSLASSRPVQISSGTLTTSGVLSAAGLSMLSGSLSAAGAMVFTGPVTQTAGTLSAPGGLSITAPGSTVVLPSSANIFGGGVSLSVGSATLASASPFGLAGTVGGALQVVGASVALGDIAMGRLGVGGPLSINVTGQITQGAAVNVTGLSTFAAGNIQMPLPSVYGGGVRFNSAGAVQLASAGAVAVGGNAGGTLDLTSLGPVTQLATLTASGASIRATGQSVVLNGSGNNLGLLSFDAGSLALRNDGPLSIAGNAASLLDLSVGATLSQFGAVTVPQMIVQALISGTRVDLSDGANNIGSAGFASSGGGYGSVNYRTAAGTPSLQGPLIANGPVSLAFDRGGVALPAVTAPSLSVRAAGSLTHQPGVVMAVNSLDLSGASIGSVAQPFALGTPGLTTLVASGGDIFAQGSGSLGLQSLAAANGSAFVSTTGPLTFAGSANTKAGLTLAGAGLGVSGKLTGGIVSLASGGGDLSVLAGNGPTSVKGDTVALSGNNVSLLGGGSSGQAVDIFDSSSVTVTAKGDFVISGGDGASAHAAITSDGPASITVGGTFRLVGGAGANAFAKLDPAVGQPMTITAGEVLLQGGSRSGAYAALTSDGDITIKTPKLTLRKGTGIDADAVILSYFGSVSYPAGCDGCLKLDAPSLGNGLTEAGIMGGNDYVAVLLSGILSAAQQSGFAVNFDKLVSGEDTSKNKKKDASANVVVETAVCSNGS